MLLKLCSIDFIQPPNNAPAVFFAKCWFLLPGAKPSNQLYQIRLVYTQKSYLNLKLYKSFQKGLDLAKLYVLQLFLPRPANLFNWL